MTCHYINERRLFDFADGRLAGVTLTLVTAHLDNCAECRGVASDYVSLMTHLRAGERISTTADDDPWAPVARTLSEPDWVVLALADAAVLRDSQGPLTLVSQHLDWLSELTPADPNAALLLGYLALWLTEMGLAHLGENPRPSYMGIVASGLRRFPRQPRPGLRVEDCLHLELAEGLVALNAERNAEAIEHLDHVLHLAPEVGDTIVLTATLGALARAYARLGAYDDATSCSERAITAALAAGYVELAASHQTRLAWTLFQMHGCCNEAVERLLDQSAHTLEETEDRIGRGNIAAAQAKIASHRGHYEQAFHLYTSAIDLYDEFWREHPNLARALLNRSKARLRTVARLRRTSQGSVLSVFRDSRSPSEPIDALLCDAEADVQRADQIYRACSDVRGRGSVHLARAYLRMWAAEPRRAALEAAAAYDVGFASGDQILMARARVIQCHLAVAESSSPGGDPRSEYRLPERAREFSDEAIAHVKTTQHRRLAATAWLWQGLTLVQPYFGRHVEAAECLARVRELLPEGTHDYLQEQVDELARAVDGQAPDVSQPHPIAV